jgi:hypothetical protein
MSGATYGRASIPELCQLLENLLSVKQLAAEVEYRIRKLLNRTVPLTDKMFPKTVKGQELIADCMKQAQGLRQCLECGDRDVYYALTALERTYEELASKTVEFRVKAG